VSQKGSSVPVKIG